MSDFIIQQGVLKQYTGSEAVVAVPDGVQEIGYGAFRGDSTVRQVVLPDGVRKIGSMAFAGCGALEQIRIPPTVVEIGYSAFERCGQLKAVQLPEGLVLLDRMAFFGLHRFGYDWFSKFAAHGRAGRVPRYGVAGCPTGRRGVCRQAGPVLQGRRYSSRHQSRYGEGLCGRLS